jgi:hypothetical protein
MAGGDCKVDISDRGQTVGTITIKNGKSVDIGNNTRLTCKDGNITVSPSNERPLRGEIQNPLLAVTKAGLSLTRKREQR